MKHIDRQILQLAHDVIDLDDETNEDHAPDLSRMAEDARTIIAKMQGKARPKKQAKVTGQEEADRERGARIAGLTMIRIDLHKEQGGTCPICAGALKFELMHAHHILSGPERRAEELQETMVGVHERCHDWLHGKDARRDQREALALLLGWCVSTGRIGAAMSITRRIAKIDEARAAAKR